MLSLWKRISKIGIKEDMDFLEVRAISLLNQISVLSIVVFLFSMIIPGALSKDNITVLIGIINIVLFSICLMLNSFRLFTLSKNFIIISGIGIVTFISIYSKSVAGNQVNYVTLPIMTLLIFRDIKTIYRYYILIILAFLLTVYIQKVNFTGFVESDQLLINVYYINLFINFFLMTFLLIYFFRNLQNQYERKLLKKNEELAEANIQLKKAQSQLVLSERMASIGQLTAGIAHEINNPINFVISSLNPIRNDLADVKGAYKEIEAFTKKENTTPTTRSFWEKVSEDYQLEEVFPEIDQLLEGVREGANRTKEIVAGLREFTRLDEDGLKKVNLHESINRTITMISHLCTERVHIVRHYGNIPLIDGVPGKINQVFMNLLENAIHAIPGKGEIVISTVKKGEEILIQIKDNGIGVPLHIKDQIFEPFFTTKEVGNGKGLGLSISLGIMEQHHGKLWLEETSDKGSTFSLSFPLTIS